MGQKIRLNDSIKPSLWWKLVFFNPW
jgi:hypothetical protein